MQEPLRPCRSATGTPGLTLVMLLLSLAVFSWGLHYKLSLYNAPARSSAPQVAAKLLSQQERATPQVQQLTNVEPMLLPALFALLLAASFPVGGAVPVRELSRQSSHPGGMSKALRRRPPPAAIS